MKKDTIIAFLIIGIILIFTQTSYYKKLVMPNAPPVKQRRTTEDTLRRKQPVAKPAEKEGIAVPAEKTAQEKKKLSAITINKNNILKGIVSGYAVQGKPKVITIETDLYEAKLSSRGGTIMSWKLKKYKNYKGKQVQLIADQGKGDLSLSFFVNNDTIDFGKVNYDLQVENNPMSDTLVILNQDHPTATIFGKVLLNDGKEIVKKYTFFYNKYNFNFHVKLEGFDNWVNNKSYYVSWKSGLLPTEKRIHDDEGYAKVYMMLGKELDEFAIGNKREYKKKKITGSVVWGDIRTKYFTMAIISKEKEGRGAILEGRGVPITKKNVIKKYSITIEMPLNSGNITSDNFTVFIGPLEYNTVRKLGVKLDKIIMSSGWYERLFRPFSIAILVSFKFLHKFIPNYGWVIVLFSILIKILVYPLTHKSYVSMKKMQLVQPKMAELKEKYKSDPQRMNKETMKLYKSYGVNPMGGCLPSLLQMPLLVGLFIVFRSTIELRGAPFIFWMTNLSMPDTVATLPFTLPMFGNSINVLPILMGITMFFQQKMTTQDPKQKSLTYLMPIFFVLLFNTFPSGLNLYYTLFNLFTIVQQHLIKPDVVQLKAVEKKQAKQTARQKSHRPRK